MTDKAYLRQQAAWLLTATVGPILSVTGRSGWLGVLPVAVLCPLLCGISGKNKAIPRWLCVVELLWLIVFLSGIAPISGGCWESAGKHTAIPTILLLLAAFASCRGEEKAARIGATLLWLVMPILGIVILVGTADIHSNWIQTKPELADGTLISLLLVPALSIMLPGNSASGKRVPWVLGLVAVAGSLLLEATMGRIVAAGAENAFYEFSKGINLFGAAERFESLVACVLTLSWFALFCMILSTAHHLMAQIMPGIGNWAVWCVAAASAILLYIMPNDGVWLAAGSLIFWVVLPVGTQVLVPRKKDVKK